MQTFNLEVVSNANGTIVSDALNYWQTLAPNGGGIAVGLIVEVHPCVTSLLYEFKKARRDSSAKITVPGSPIPK